MEKINSSLRHLNALALLNLSEPVAQDASAAVADPTPVVWVSVSGHPLGLPEPLLNESLYSLHLGMMERVPLGDYAKAVAHILSGLANQGLLHFPADGRGVGQDKVDIP